MLRRCVEINHHVAAKNEVKRSLYGPRRRDQVQLLERNEFLQLWLRFYIPAIAAFTAQKIAFAPLRRNGSQMALLVDSCPRFRQYLCIEVGGKNSDVLCRELITERFMNCDRYRVRLFARRAGRAP